MLPEGVSGNGSERGQRGGALQKKQPGKSRAPQDLRGMKAWLEAEESLP